MTLYVAYKTFVTKQTTYCNFLKIWINRETDMNTIAGIMYGSELPEDLASQMNEILASAAEEIQNVIGRMTQALKG